MRKAPASSQAKRLSRRVEYFFGSNSRKQAELRYFLDAVKPFGEVALVGGMLRDLWLVGNRGFASDVDFAIDARDTAGFNALIETLDAVRNSFGGYKVKVGSWRVDIWVLANTWAARAGHCTVSTLADLPQTTFFDWDAIIYRFETGEINCLPNYFDRVDSRVIDVNLEPNPNILGTIVRSLRFVRRREAYIGVRLAQYLARKLPEFSDDQISAIEWSAFRTRYLTSGFLEHARSEIYNKAWMSTKPLEIIRHPALF